MFVYKDGIYYIVESEDNINKTINRTMFYAWDKFPYTDYKVLHYTTNQGLYLCSGFIYICRYVEYGGTTYAVFKW